MVKLKAVPLLVMQITEITVVYAACRALGKVHRPLLRYRQ